MSEATIEPDTTKPSIHSRQIAQQFEATGVAQVIVVLKRAQVAAAAVTTAATFHEATLANLSRHFVTSDLSHDSAILSALGELTPRAAAAGLSVPRKPKARPPEPVR